LNSWENKHLYTSILPLNNEFSWEEFRKSFFRYINTRDLKREWPWILSRFVPSIW
jgi:hypothetical protein